MSVPPTPASLKPLVRPAMTQAGQWGRVTDDGTVYLKAPEGEVLVGQYAAGTPAEGLIFYARKYDDLVVEVDILESRLNDSKINAEAASAVLTKVRETLAARSFVGDIATLESRLEQLASKVEEHRSIEKERKAKIKEQSKERREQLASEAESLAESNSWKSTAERYAEIVTEWKSLPRVDRNLEQQLWKRLSSSRTTFDRRRRAHFHELDAVRKEALSRKKELIASAQAAVGTTDPKAGIKKFKDLMAEWKKAPRGSRQDEDKLWKRFKAAQDEFFSKLKAAGAQEDEKLKGNIPAKEALVTQAEALLPLEGKEVKALKKSLRDIQIAWDKAGELPKAERSRLEGRLKKVEDAIRKEDEKQWTKSNPEALARAEETANAFSDGLAKYEADLQKALAAGDTKKAEKIQNSIDSLRALLGAVESTAADLGK